MKHDYSRRDFLKISSQTLASTALMTTFGGGINAAYGADTSGYKAMVCIFLLGGNDGFNWIVPNDTTSTAYSRYLANRGAMALDPTKLLSLNGKASDGFSYGMHPNCPELRNLFNAGHAAVLGGVGSLRQPTSVTEARNGTKPLPPQLFSHVDQQAEWMTAYPQSLEKYGWAGRLADLLKQQGAATPNLAFNINVGGATYWQEGKLTVPYVLGLNGAPVLFETSNNTYRNSLRQNTSLSLLNQAQNDTSPFVQQYAAVRQNAANKVTLVNNALAAAGDFSATTVAKFAPPQADYVPDIYVQLHEVARVIKAQSQIGDSRQMFWVTLGGFDTHNGQLNSQGALLGYVSKYIQAFYDAMTEINMQNNVTLFTNSDFGRTVGTNSDGTDHAWSSHAMVVGGAVKANSSLGSNFYGTMPNLTINGPDDFNSGRIVPTTSTDQYAATLARWFGVADADLTTLFPNLANFTTRNLGFLG